MSGVERVETAARKGRKKFQNEAERQQLGKYMRQLVDAQPMLSINQISSITQMNRSSIYQIFDGKRAPTLKFLRDLIHLLRLTDVQIAKLYDMYHTARDGAWATTRNREVMSFFSVIRRGMAEDDPYCAGEPNEREMQRVAGRINSRRRLEETAELLIRHEVYSQEDPSVYAFLSTPSLLGEDFLPECLRRCAFPGEKQLSLRQILEIDRSQELEKMDVVRFLAPIKLAVSLYCNRHVRYEPSITYTDLSTSAQPCILYPNYLLFSDAVLLIASDGESGVCIQGRENAEAWRNAFEMVQNFAYCIEMKAHDFQSAMEQYFAFTDDLASASEHFTVSQSPVLYPQYTRDLLEKYVHPWIPGREVILQQILDYYGAWEKINRGTHHYILFSEKGLMDFVESGISSEIPDKLVRPVEPEDRLRLLPDRAVIPSEVL